MRTVLRLVLLGAVAITCVAGTASGAAAACPNESLRYGYGAHLPDCRAYEQATPVEKDGAVPQYSYNAVQAADGGGGITFFAQAGMPGGTGAGGLPLFVSSRSGESWTTQGLQPPPSSGQITNVIGWTPNLAESFGLGAEFDAGGFDLVARNNLDGTVQTILPPTNKVVNYYFAGASADGEQVYFEQPEVPLTPEAAGPRKDNLYVWDRATGAIGLAGVLPASACGTPPCVPAGGSFAGGYNWYGHDEVTHGGAAQFQLTQAEHTISANGQMAYFTAGGTGQIYLRKSPTSPSASTVQVSASQKTNGTGSGGADPNGPQPAAFMMANPDGSQALFTSKEELTNDANTGTADEGNDLYRYEASSGVLTDLTPDSSDPNGAEVQGVIGASEDGSYVYFVANGDLDGTGPATTGSCEMSGMKSSGECSLYRWHDGEITFVARLDTAGEINAVSPVLTAPSDATNWEPYGNTPEDYLAYINTGRVTPDGHVVVFRSKNKLTGYENKDVPEFYRYDALTGQIDCVSCNPSGAAPTARPTFATKTSYSAAGAVAAIDSRILSDSGSEVFFETAESLLPTDTNGVEDAYEWEVDGAGSCESSADNGGCLYLISTGTSPEPSHFGDASASGEDVFIFTGQSLVGQDQDQLVDVYDARVDGGLRSQREESTTPCFAEECKASPSAGATLAPPASAVFTGLGNLVVPRCRSLTSRSARMERRATAAGRRVKLLHKRIQRLPHRGKPRRVRRLRRRMHAARRAAHRLRLEARSAAAEARRCRGASEGASK